MLIYPISHDSKLILSLLMDNPVFFAIISEYDFDEKYIYIPEDRISDKELVEEFIKKGLLIRIDNKLLEPAT